MKLGLSQTVRPELQLRLSPQILQRIEVLQLPAVDLAQMIERELEQNEALESEAEHDRDADAPAADSETAEESDWDDERLDALYDEDGTDWRPAPSDRISQMEFVEASTAAPVTLDAHLHTQLDLIDLDERNRAIAAAIVEALNPRGWLELPLDELDVDLSPPATPEEREHALHVVQGLEPAGIACRDMEECLLLQLEADRPDYELLVTLILQHLNDIAHNRIPRIVRETGASVEEVLAGIDAISHLDPVPGRSFGQTVVPSVRPDVTVRPVGDDYEISLENDWIPNLAVSRSYLGMVRDRSVDPDLRKHIRGKIEGAQSLIDAIEQRKHTLFRVASELITRQPGFLEHGMAALRPLRMQEVADALGVHVSTVSRAISGKSMQTHRGIVPMKALFTGEVPSRGTGGDGGSRASVQELIRDIVAHEDRTRPLSDEAIVKILSEKHGLDIARRTVTKYRKALGLGSSRARRIFGPQ